MAIPNRGRISVSIFASKPILRFRPIAASNARRPESSEEQGKCVGEQRMELTPRSASEDASLAIKDMDSNIRADNRTQKTVRSILFSIALRVG